MEHIRKSLVLTLILCLALAMLPAMAQDAQPFYKTLDPNTEGSIDIMVWSGDSTYYEDIGAKEWAPEDMTSQNVAAVHALAKQFKQLYPKVKVNLWAKTDDPHGNGTSWYQEMENFKAQHGKHPDIYASTDLAGDVSLGLVADLLSKPIRIGFLNAIALTVLTGQLPKVFGFSVKGDALPDKAVGLIEGIAAGHTHRVALAIGAGSLAFILLLKRHRPRWPGILLAVVLATLVSGQFDLSGRTGLPVLGALPQGLPEFRLPVVSTAEILRLLPGAFIISLLSFADTSVLSRALAQRGGYAVSQNQEMIALGAANIASGLFQGLSISSSASRTPVAEAAGARTQLTGLIGALAIALLLVLAPTLLQSLPSAVLGAVVIAACLSFADLRGMAELYRLRRVEFGLSLISFLGVAFVGVIEGIFIAIALALLVLVWNTWHPHSAILARVDGAKGYHDISRHPEGRQVPGLVLFRWDAPLFFANAELFREQILGAVSAAPTPTRWVVVAADAITDVDITGADVLVRLQGALDERGITLHFAGLKGPVKDRLRHYGTLDRIGQDIFSPTVGSAVHLYRSRHDVDWKDWDEA